MKYSKSLETIQSTKGSENFSGSNAQLKKSAVSVLQKATSDEELQKKSAVVQKVEQEEELPIQGKFVTQLQAPEEEEPLQKKNNTELPENLKSGIENLSGYSMDNVQVHYNSSKPAQLQALAYAQGTDIHVAPGQEKHLPHEAWHVVQQMQGRVQPTTQMKEGVAINDDKSLESEADSMGAKALQ